MRNFMSYDRRRLAQPHGGSGRLARSLLLRSGSRAPGPTWSAARRLIAAGMRLGDGKLVSEGMRSLEWYEGELGIAGPWLQLVGHRGRRRGERRPGGGDEQPLDAAALVEAEVEAFLATGDEARARHAVRAFEWFLGRNRLRMSVYDFATGGCHDGLGEADVNRNEGAESTLAYLQALLALDAAGLQATLPE